MLHSLRPFHNHHGIPFYVCVCVAVFVLSAAETGFGDFKYERVLECIYYERRERDQSRADVNGVCCSWSVVGHFERL